MKWKHDANTSSNEDLGEAVKPGDIILKGKINLSRGLFFICPNVNISSQRPASATQLTIKQLLLLAHWMSTSAPSWAYFGVNLANTVGAR